MANQLPGYASDQAIRQQAAQAASAAVPTRGSIMRQYGQSLTDTAGFTRALVGLLRGLNVGGGYAPAISQQQGIDQAAANRIAAVTGQSPTTAGSAAAVGGIGDSAMSHLVANQAAARTYGAQLPAVGASRGALARQSLITARNQALQTRGEDYRSAFGQALGQARQNALAYSEALGNLNLNQQRLAFDAQTQAQNNQYRYAALQQNSQQFNRSQALQWQEFQTKLRASLQGGSAPGLAGYTPSEISGLQKRGSDYVQNTAVLHGVPIQTAIRNLMAQGIPRSIAVYEAQEGYATMTAPRQAEFRGVDSKGNKTYNGLGYQQALRAYHSALGSFRKWVTQRQYNQTLRLQKGQGTAPGQGRGVG